MGLGNPGREYEATRHNVGWWVLDHLADVWRFEGFRRQGEALVTAGTVGTQRVRLVKPQTYMNLSGAVLAPYVRHPFWSAKADLLVVVDESHVTVPQVNGMFNGEPRFRLHPHAHFFFQFAVTAD